jgi:hypothetical protein
LPEEKDSLQAGERPYMELLLEAAALEEENQRLKKLVADLSLDKEMLQDVIRRKI